MIRRPRLIKSVPIVCHKLAGLGVLADLARRRNSNLRAVNGGRGTKSVPGHHIFNSLQLLSSLVLFHFVPIPNQACWNLSQLRMD